MIKKINALKTELTKLKCENIEIIQENENQIKEINFDFQGIYSDGLQFLKIEFYNNANLKKIECFCCRQKGADKDFTYNYIDENDPQNIDFQSFSIVPKCFQYLKIISDVLKHEYFIPILISVNPITYNLKSTITLVETFCYKEPTIYDIWKEKIYNRLAPFNLSESITNEILVVMSELIKEYEGDDDDDL